MTLAERTCTPRAVATDARVTPAQATSACSRMSPEHACVPSPPVAGCSPATTSPAHVPTVAVSACWSTVAVAVLLTTAEPGSSR